MYRIGSLALAVAALFVVRAYADDVPASDSVQIQPLFAGGSASDDELTQAVGTPSFSMDTCPASESGDDERVVRVQLEKAAFETAPVINALLDKAARYAWETCPEPFVWLASNQPTGQFRYDLSEVDAYLPDGTQAFKAVLGMYGMGDGAFAPGRTYPWRNYTNFAALARAKTAADAQTQANAQAQAAYESQVQAQTDATMASARKAGSNLWTAVKLIFFLLFAWGLWLAREPVIRWYYELTPHPASGTVSAALAGGGPIDGRAFADVLRTPTGNRYEQEVRARQAHELARRLRERAEAQMAELARAKAEAQRTAAYRRAQSDLASAVEAHELMKARLDALRNRGAFGAA
jgi:hypothetical protein